MFLTPRNQILSKKIKANNRQSIANNEDTYANNEEPLSGGRLCKTCGGRIQFKDVVKGLKSVGKMAKPYVHQAIKKGAIAAGTAAGAYFGNPEFGAIAGNEAGNIASAGYDKIVGGKMKMKHIKGSPSLTHIGDLDYTTKKGDEDYHSMGHDVKKSSRPYSSWISHVKAYSQQHNMKYNEALKNAGCKASYHKTK